jgi:hypothetical protein
MSCCRAVAGDGWNEREKARADNIFRSIRFAQIALRALETQEEA